MNVQMIGSCRINFPLEILNKEGGIKLVNRWWGFTHYTKEVLQLIKAFSGVVPDKSIFDLVNWEHLDTKRWLNNTCNREVLDDIDVVVIELSSIKTFESNGAYLQINRIVDAFKEFSELFPSWPYFSKDAKDFGEISKYISDPVKARLLKNLKIGTTNKKELGSDLAFIKSYFELFGVKKVIVVTHFSCGPDGEVIPGRRKVIDDIIDVCR